MAGGNPACDGGAISFSQVDTTLRRVGEATGEPQCYDTYVPGPGLLLLEADVSSMDQVEPRLEPMDHSCNRGDTLDQAFSLADRTPSSLVAEIRRAGRFQFCINAQDPEHALGTYRLSNLFVSTVATKEGDPTENEPDPDPLVFVSAHGELRRACVRGLEDDYSDTFRCAGPLTAERVYGWLGNAWNDDADVFVLEVEELTTVRLGTTGAIDTLGALYDRFGQRLAIDDDGGEGGNFRLVKTLVGPGRYFVRVEGRNGSEGAYQLELDLLDPMLVGDR